MGMHPIPEFRPYYHRNNGANSLVFEVDGISYYFSYQTLVAFDGPKHGLTVHENIWSRTTGAHLNAIDGGAKVARVDAATFASRLAEELNR